MRQETSNLKHTHAYILFFRNFRSMKAEMADAIIVVGYHQWRILYLIDNALITQKNVIS